MSVKTKISYFLYFILIWLSSASIVTLFYQTGFSDNIKSQIFTKQSMQYQPSIGGRKELAIKQDTSQFPSSKVAGDEELEFKQDKALSDVLLSFIGNAWKIFSDAVHTIINTVWSIAVVITTIKDFRQSFFGMFSSKNKRKKQSKP